MNEELTRVFEKYELEAMIEYYKNNDCSRRVAIELATALLEERAKPKVWDFAPEWANVARVRWFKPDYPESMNEVFSKLHTRELPKTRARKYAEEIEKALSTSPRYKTEVEIIESALNKYAEELKGEA